jgi:hypothetical protein
MRDRAYEAAIARLTSFAAAKALSAELMMRFYWAITLVLRMVREDHRSRVRDGRKVKRQPTSLAPEIFLWWFKEWLVHTVVVKIEKYPNNPV